MAKGKKGGSKPESTQEGLLSEEEMEDLAVLDRDPGGPIPSKSILKLSSYKKEIANQFKEEEEVIFSMHTRCEFVGFGGGKRIHEFDVLDIFQDADLDEEIVERFKDKLEEFSATAKNKAVITEFLDSCLEEPDVAPELAAAEAEEPEEPAETPESQADEAEAELGNMGAPQAEEPPAEEVDGEIVPESDASALDAAANDLDWGGEPPASE